ncbi:MAG: 50S ribosomal protein L22 [Mycoplasmataceae bacterium]|jgi:ribosomal protein L22|nr:50S ribosomal protein L22 [Mycoplasmataceae bacterium]
MLARAIQKNIAVTSRKAGLVCDLIRGKEIKQAGIILQNTHKRVAKIILKLLNQAIANATNNHAMDASKLYVYNAIANQGTTIKRTLPRAKGSADLLKLRHSHIEITLSDDKNERKNEVAKTKAKKSKKVSKEGGAE